MCKIVDFAVPPGHRIKLKECEEKDKYFDLARELKKLWNMKVTIIPIVIGAFGTVTKGLLKGLEDLEVGSRGETIQTTALLITARILRRVLETWEDLLSLNLQWNTLSLRWCEKLEWVMIIINCPVRCRIHQLHLSKVVTPPTNKCPGYDTKQSDSEVSVLLGL